MRVYGDGQTVANPFSISSAPAPAPAPAAVNADYHMGILYDIVTLPKKSNQRTPQPLTLATLSFLTASFFGNCLSNFAAPVADPWISKIILSKLA